MNPKKLVQEVIFGIYKVEFLHSFLSASLVFLVIYVSLMLFNLPNLPIAGSFAVLYFITSMVIFSRVNKLAVIESKYPDLSEELRTVKDTLDENNELTAELRDDVGKKAKREIDLGDFVDFKHVLSRILMIFFCSFLIILVASLNIQVLDANALLSATGKFINSLIDDAVKGTQERIDVIASQNDLTQRFKKLALQAGIKAGEQSGGEIFGDSELAMLGNEKMNFEIKPTEFEVDVNNFEAPEKMDFSNKPFGETISADQEYALEERIPQKRQAIVKRYFEQLAKS